MKRLDEKIVLLLLSTAILWEMANARTKTLFLRNIKVILLYSMMQKDLKMSQGLLAPWDVKKGDPEGEVEYTYGKGKERRKRHLERKFCKNALMKT